MAADIATLSQLLQASLDPRQNKQGTKVFCLRPAVPLCSEPIVLLQAEMEAASDGLMRHLAKIWP